VLALACTQGRLKFAGAKSNNFISLAISLEKAHTAFTFRAIIGYLICRLPGSFGFP